MIVPLTFWKETALSHNVFQQYFENVCSNDRMNKMQLQSKRFMRAPLASKFLVQPSNAECGGLETAYKDSCQMFQHSKRMFEQILQISFKISFGAWAFQTKISRRKRRALLAWQSSRFQLEYSWITCCSKFWMWEGKQKEKRFISVSNLNELKGKGKTRYT